MSRKGGTSESDLPFIGFGPYADTLSRLDGGKDHTNKIDQKISAEDCTYLFF